MEEVNEKVNTIVKAAGEHLKESYNSDQTFENLPEVNLKKLNYGDFVIVYESRDVLKYFILEKGNNFHNKYGLFKHDDMYGKSFGTKIYSTRGQGYITILDFIPHLWERCINRMTQILFNPDISTVLTFLDIKSNSVIYESGTGSGCLSTNISQILNEGHLYTFEFNKERAEKLKSVFKFVGLEKRITVINRDVIEDGFDLDLEMLQKPEDGKCDGIFIDLPSPWKIIQKAKAVLKTGGNFVSFSPCIEQIDQTMKALREHNFIYPRMFECTYRNFNYARSVKINMPCLSTKRKFGDPILTQEKEFIISNSRSDMRGHTGYIINAINS
jgi:tRNA (adenine57-N1/adenine58-N1)-methyltransferase